ncbi:PspC domain-containing protein [Lapidilactobacillus gannanensis]|jgi:phage shock protein PspC (stress-responsive transcriptional regulator)|uniref:PspC domain-containing protein n=1 Tax=Lapidilactobacillus gannanensis TaxID=2486002 RepID=A0ABW4BMK7_9LACO|nr:PspC domain-containing protein [Lapidilactobacillus gannanensis]MCH4056612.1 PspC domain-containing protein [Lactobacillaceae bacterium]
MEKKLYRSVTNRKFAGVCGGLGEYFNVDPTLIRIIFVIAFFFAGVGLLPYIILMIVMPNPPQGYDRQSSTDRHHGTSQQSEHHDDNQWSDF